MRHIVFQVISRRSAQPGEALYEAYECIRYAKTLFYCVRQPGAALGRGSDIRQSVLWNNYSHSELYMAGTMWPPPMPLLRGALFHVGAEDHPVPPLRQILPGGRPGRPPINRYGWAFRTRFVQKQKTGAVASTRSTPGRSLSCCRCSPACGCWPWPCCPPSFCPLLAEFWQTGLTGAASWWAGRPLRARRAGAALWARYLGHRRTAGGPVCPGHF